MPGRQVTAGAEPVPTGHAGPRVDRVAAHWSEFQRGKHFPAMEAPAQLAADLQSFFGPLR